MIEDVVQGESRGHEHVFSVVYEIVAMAKETLCAVFPGDHWANFPARIPVVRTGAEFTIVEASEAIGEDELRLVGGKKKVNNFRLGRAL